MPHAFVQLTPDLDRACREALVLTTTERLRRNLILAYNDARRREGRRAWTTPNVRTLESHLALVHAEQRASDPRLPVLLSAEAEFQLFQTTAPRGAAGLVPLAQQAWALCQQWAIPITPAGFTGTENGRVFLEWSERLRRRLEGGNALTRAELAGRVGLIGPEPALACLAFERLPHAFTRWLDRQAAAGCRVTFLDGDPGRQARSSSRTTFDTPGEELAAVAQWSRELFSRHAGDLCVGVVVPDLGRRQQAVLRQFTAVFDPGLETGIEAMVDIASGSTLGEQPVWRGARDWLRLCFDTLPAVTARRCLNDPFLQLPTLGQLPAALPTTLDLRALDRLLELPGLRQRLAELPQPGDRTVADWLNVFAGTLAGAGWTGQSAGTVQYQAWEAIHRCMAALGGTSDQRRLPARQALAELDQLLGNVTFAPERPPAPVQVMGYLETTGLQFTHLWITGLDDRSWPQLPTLNPFVPVRARRQHGVARSTPAAETDFAKERLRQWQASTDVLIVSHVRTADESECRPSPLIRAFPQVSLPYLRPRRAHPEFNHRPGHVEEIRDSHGAPLPAGQQRGGTGRIRDQAICPIRGYAIHRLRLEEARPPHGLPDALDRGTLIHEALHRLYEPGEADASRKPAELATADFERAADRALVRHYGRFPAPFKSRERLRLVALLGVWNELESRRSDATIEALELDATPELDGIGLRLRIDRLDRIEDALVVIDYKTGRLGYRLNDDRLVDPQLPIYALTHPDIRGVLYAEVDERQPRLKGIAALPVDQATVDAPLGGTWTHQLDRWRRQLDTLTREIRAGLATVSPYAPGACQRCHLHAFCRIALDTDGAET